MKLDWEKIPKSMPDKYALYTAFHEDVWYKVQYTKKEVGSNRPQYWLRIIDLDTLTIDWISGKSIQELKDFAQRDHTKRMEQEEAK